MACSARKLVAGTASRWRKGRSLRDRFAKVEGVGSEDQVFVLTGNEEACVPDLDWSATEPV
jgi:hypothetical protein